jgi:hypothetical protein
LPDEPSIFTVHPVVHKFREQQAKTTAKETADATLPAQRKRTKAEAIVNSIGTMVNKIGDLDFPSFSTEDREMIIETDKAY